MVGAILLPGGARPRTVASAASECVGDQLAHASEELRTHPRMKSIAIDAAERQQTDRWLSTEWDHRHRTYIGRLGAKQKLALRIADLAAARLACREQRVEAAIARIVGVYASQKTPA